MADSEIKRLKSEIRERIWKILEEKNLAAFPRPVKNRIPNFIESEKAALNLSRLPAFHRAHCVKVNPDAPQRRVRLEALSQGKIVIMPPPRLRGDFIKLDPKDIPSHLISRASTINGAFSLGKAIELSRLPVVDMVVVGSVAVSPDGARLGKGEGYAELEYAILRESGIVGEKVPVCTTVHDVQVVANIPFENHDVPVDLIATPTKLIETETEYSKPSGVFWSKLSAARIDQLPLIKKLRPLDKRVSGRF